MGNSNQGCFSPRRAQKRAITDLYVQKWLQQNRFIVQTKRLTQIPKCKKHLDATKNDRNKYRGLSAPFQQQQKQLKTKTQQQKRFSRTPVKQSQKIFEKQVKMNKKLKNQFQNNLYNKENLLKFTGFNTNFPTGFSKDQQKTPILKLSKANISQDIDLSKLELPQVSILHPPPQQNLIVQNFSGLT